MDANVNSIRQHWWPDTLAKHWCDGNDRVSTILPNGKVHRNIAGHWGAINHAHNLMRGSPWKHSFEGLFADADREINYFIEWLFTLNVKNMSDDSHMVERIVPIVLDDERLRQIARITASLLARSPAIRDSIKRGNEQFRRKQDWPDQTVDKNLVAANQRGLYDAYRKHMEGFGRWAILFSDEREFIAGDGFFHNFPASQDAIHSGKKLVLPILPTAAIIFMSPKSFPTEPKLVTLRVSSQEVETINEITQVYASNFIFFREQKPKLIKDYKVGKHLVYEYHGHRWLDSLLDDLSQFSNWGKDGAAVISNKRYFSESVEGEYRLQQMLSGTGANDG